MKNKPVLVTGGSGFLAAHCILKLLEAGYDVRTTVRSLKRESDVRAMIKVGGRNVESDVGFFEADLMSDGGWKEAVSGCELVLHVASPFPLGAPKTEDELIIPAREGALRVLRASRDAGVKRVVLTSSFAAIGYGHSPTDRPFNEQSWTDTTANVAAYVKSKAIAERAAWDFVESEARGLELSVVNPVAIFGPVLGPDLSSSIFIVKQLLSGALSRIPRINLGVVDVRDVADLHIAAMTNPVAKGERFIAMAGFMSLLDGAKLLKERLGEAGSRISTRPMADWMVRLASPFNPAARRIVPDLGKVRRSTSEKAKTLLGWEPRSAEDAIVSTAESLLRLGLA